MTSAGAVSYTHLLGADGFQMAFFQWLVVGPVAEGIEHGADFNSLLDFLWVNHAIHRDHRKIVVIDGKIGYTGGMSIADYYINGLPKIGKWHDMHIDVYKRQPSK